MYTFSGVSKIRSADISLHKSVAFGCHAALITFLAPRINLCPRVSFSLTCMDKSYLLHCHVMVKSWQCRALGAKNNADVSGLHYRANTRKGAISGDAITVPRRIDAYSTGALPGQRETNLGCMSGRARGAWISTLKNLPGSLVQGRRSPTV